MTEEAIVLEAPHALSAEAVSESLSTGGSGLDVDEAAARLESYGPNRLPEPPKQPEWLKFIGHFNDTLIYILLASGVIKALMGDWIDFTVIMAVTIINALIGYLQEGRAEEALAGIRSMLSAGATAMRGGEWVHVEADALVPGDLVRVAPGDKVPADIRLVDANNLRVEESALTGESLPSSKGSEPVAEDAGIGDRSSMLFSGTLVAAGQGAGIVTATGIHTEIGRIQQMISGEETLETPLTRQLADFGKRLSLIILGVAAIMLVIGRVLHSFPLPDLLSAAIGFAVAAIPEGLPALVTITLALGVQQMAKRHAITRKLTAVETLGSVTTICSDKTGTLTKNEMTVRTAVTSSAEYSVDGLGYAPIGGVSLDGAAAPLADHRDLFELAGVMALCNDAEVREDDAGRWTVVGEPTEGALRTFAVKAGFDGAGVTRNAVLPFDSAYKYMATSNSSNDGHAWLSVKGAPDRVFDRCSAQRAANGATEPFDREFWEQRMNALGSQGLRVLAAATNDTVGDTTVIEHEDLDQGLTLVGIVGIIDPPRPEAIEAIAASRSAGIVVKMITGDHAGTAKAIALEMGIVDSADAPVLTGAELEAMSQEELKKVAPSVNVYARTSPEHKIRIVKALQSRGEVVSMTGDGVNDAPALTRADVGVAMGIKGTEATKEAAEIVLADDNFATIERAIEEGRRIYDNLRKSVVFLLPTNGAQSLVILIAVLFGLALPLAPVQVLWVNMVTAITLSLALAYEPAEANIMLRPPRKPGGSIVSGSALVHIAFVSVLIGGATLLVFYIERSMGNDLAAAQTMSVTMLALGQLAYLFNCRFLSESSFTPRVLKGNRTIWISAGSLIVLQIVFTYAPFMHTWFGSAPLDPRGWLIPLALSLVVFVLVEAGKALQRRLGSPIG